MTITIDTVEDAAARCNLNATYSTTLSQVPSFTAIRSCVIDYIVDANSLTPAEKIYYLVNDFYIQSFKSWIRNSSKIHSTKSYSANEVRFAASKIGDLLGLSKKKIFNIQKKLESLGFLQIDRSVNQYGMNNVNVSSVTLPKNIFSYLISKAENKSFSFSSSDVTDIFNIPPDQRKEVINKAKQFIPINFDLFRFVFFHKHLSCSSKLLYIKLFSIIHKIKKKYNYPIYASGLDTDTIIKNCNISRTTLFRSIKQLQEHGLIKCKKIRTESEDKSSNRFDKLINYIQILVPKELEHILVNNNSAHTDANTETSVQAAENISEKETTVPKVPPVDTKSSYLINKIKQAIKLVDKEKIDKKEINQLIESISNFFKYSSNFKEKEVEDKTSEPKQNKLSAQDKSFEKKSLLDFYPLSSDDCAFLQRESGKNFSLNAMNEILKSLTHKLVNPIFYSKKSFMAYMAKIFKHEMRDPAKINNEAFKILANMSEEERKTYEIEKYLTQIENTPLEIVTPEWHLKKKLACVLKPETAYELLKNYKGVNIYGSKATIELYRHVDLEELEKEVVLRQVKATHERMEEGGTTFIPIEEIEFLMPPKRKTENKDKKPEVAPRTGIWGDIRTTIAKSLSYGSSTTHGDAIDACWFSKLEAEIDAQTKQITLKAPNEFMKDWVFENYQSAIDEAAMSHGYIFKGIYTEGNTKGMLEVWRKQEDLYS